MRLFVASFCLVNVNVVLTSRSGDNELPVFTISLSFFKVQFVIRVQGFFSVTLQVSFLTCLGAFMSPYFLKKIFALEMSKAPLNIGAITIFGFLSCKLKSSIALVFTCSTIGCPVSVYV